MLPAWLFLLLEGYGVSLVAQQVKNPIMQETRVPFLGWEDPVEKGQAPCCSILGLPWWLRQ